MAAFGLFMFRDFIAASLKVPFLLPAFSSLALLLGRAVLLSMAIVTLAVLSPALRVSREEPAIAMRE